MSIAKEALPFAASVAIFAVLAALLLHPLAALPFVAVLAFTLWFFRDPTRSVPARPGILVAPADGKVIRADPAKISIFMNVFDVHVCRTPMAGTVSALRHDPGRFVAAWRDEASEHNERVTIEMSGDGGKLRFVLVAGLVARRIVCKVSAGQRLARGERVGLIRFGSRVDVYPPPGFRPEVSTGTRVVAGETVLAVAADESTGSTSTTS